MLLKTLLITSQVPHLTQLRVSARQLRHRRGYNVDGAGEIL